MDIIIIEFAKLIIPAAIVLYAMYLMVKSFLDKELAQRLTDIRAANAKEILPIRLQAYERISLLLQRISPNNLILRLNDSSYSYKELQQILVGHVREEYNHNLSQQIYVSDQVWDLTASAVEDVVMTINQGADMLPKDARGIDLAKKVFDIQGGKQVDPIEHALSVLKQEVRTMF